MAQAPGQKLLDSGRCKGCGAAILWVRMPSGKPMPLDPIPQKRVTLSAGPVAVGAVVDTYMPHWATCPNPPQRRKAEAEST